MKYKECLGIDYSLNVSTCMKLLDMGYGIWVSIKPIAQGLRPMQGTTAKKKFKGGDRMMILFASANVLIVT